MLKIWGRGNSVNVQKVLWAVDEIGLPHERVNAGREFGVVDTPEYAALNPNRLVPTIDDDGFILWKSNVIVRYLWQKHRPPMSPRAFAEADRWMEWYSTTFWDAAMRTVFWGLVRTPPEKRDLAAIEAARKKTGELLAIVDAALAQRPYLSGDAFGMGDIPLGCGVWRWYALDIERPKLPHLDAWFARLKERAAYAKNVMLPLS